MQIQVKHLLITGFCVLILYTYTLAQNNIPLPPEIQKNNTEKLKSNDELLAVQYYQNKEYDKAIEIYENLLNKKPDNISYYNALLNCYFEINEFGKAEKHVKRQSKRNPYNMQFKIDLGYVYQRNGNNEKASKYFESIIKDLSPEYQYVVDVAYAFYNRNLLNYAIETYKKGRKLNNNNTAFGLELADVYEKQKDFNLMMTEYVNFIAENPSERELAQGKLSNTLAEDIDGKKNEILKETLLRIVQKNPDNTYYSEMLLWLTIQQKDFETAFTQAKSLDRRLKENGEKVNTVAQLSSSNNAYDVAIKSYEYLLSKGITNQYYYNSRIEILSVKSKKIFSNITIDNIELTNLENEYKKILNEYSNKAELAGIIKDYSHLLAFYLNKSDEAINMLNNIIELQTVKPLIAADCKIELADIYLISGNVWDAILLYSQVEKDFKSEPIGHLAKFKCAKVSYYIGEFQWAKAQLDVLKAATSKLIANDAMDLALLIGENTNPDSSTTELAMYSRADLFYLRKNYDISIKILDSINVLYPQHPICDEALYKKAKIKIELKQYEEAEKILAEIYEKFPYDILADDALYLMASLNELYLNNKPKAMQLYQDLLTKYSGSLNCVEVRKKYRNLRGDNIN